MHIHTVERIAKPLSRDEVLATVQAAASKYQLRNVLEEHKLLRSHWHLKRGTQSGTLEVTWEGSESVIRVIVHKNRAGANGWARDLAPTFAETLAGLVKGAVTSHHATNGD